LNTEPLGQQVLESADASSLLPQFVYEEKDRFEIGALPRLRNERHSSALFRQEKEEFMPRNSCEQMGQSALATTETQSERLSPWSRSAAKRLFDIACVVISMPLLVPLMLAIGAAVRFTSFGPVLFMQERMGRHGRPFTIFKFRTMVHVSDKAHHPITTSDNQRFTPIGPFLRRWKLDELPQLVNVLLGHMSLVGPRPKLREHVIFDLLSRPGITGMATTVFACEETILARVPAGRLDSYYHSVVLPAKRQLDAAYMAQATFLSDLRLLVNSVLRRWDTEALNDFVVAAAFNMDQEMASSRMTEVPRSVVHRPIPAATTHPAGAEHVSAF